MTTITRIAKLEAGDLVRATKDETVITGRVVGVNRNDFSIEGAGFNLSYRLLAGWQIELLDRPAPPVPLGVYTWADQIEPDGAIKDAARIVKRKANHDGVGEYWASGEGKELAGYPLASTERAWKEGRLVGPLRLAKSQRPKASDNDVLQPF